MARKQIGATPSGGNDAVTKGFVETSTATLTNKDLTSATNTFPSTLVTLTGTQTLTGKTITSPTITTPTITSPTITTPTLEGTATVNQALTSANSTLSLREASAEKAYLQYRGTTAGTLPNTVRFQTVTGSNADIQIGTNSNANIFVAGGQNGLNQGYVGLGGNVTPAVTLDVTGEARVSVAGTNAASVVNVGGTQTLTGKTLTSPTLATPVINGTSTGTGVATANTASTLVQRDASGNFAAGTVTAALSGNATTATNLTASTSTAVGLGTIELGHATDTTLSRLSPGVLAVEGSQVVVLDSGGKVPIGQLPSSIMEYQGTWNASTNTPTLANGTGNSGDVYRVSVAGSALSLTFEVGDYVIYNGSTWEKSDTTDAVASVAGRTGNVTLTSSDVGLGNVDNTSNATERAATAALTNKDLTSGTNTFPTLNQNTTGTAAGLSSTLAVTSGGTGVTTLTGLVKGNGTGAFTVAVSGTDFAAPDQTMNIGTTSVAINRASANLGLTGITSVAMPGATSGTVTVTPAATAGTTSLTLPATTGTVAVTANKISDFAQVTSAELAGKVSDETGSGALVFGTSPTITTATLDGSATVNQASTSANATLNLTEASVAKAYLQYRGTTAGTLPNTVRFQTQSGTNADIAIGTNSNANIFVAGGQNGLTSGRVGISNSTPAVALDVTGEIRSSTAGTNAASVVNVGGTQTLTAKTLTSPKITSGNAPATAGSTGVAGQVEWDSSYVYICTATNTWKRAELLTW